MSDMALARRYAKALFELATQKKIAEKVEADLMQFIKARGEFPELGRVLKNPTISKKSIEGITSEILKKQGASELTLNFIMVLAQNGRIKYLTEIVSAYSGLMMESRGEEKAFITTAYPLQENQLAEIEKNVSKVLGSKIKAESEVNSEILGGIIVRIGSKMLDASVSGQLKNLAALQKKAIANMN